MTRSITPIEAALVQRAADGDARAVAEIVRALEKPVYGVALRMLLNRNDAEDATQEALIRIVTRLAQFRGESAFTTWAYRIAVRRILDFRDERAARHEITFEVFATDLHDGLDADAVERTENAILYHQLKVVCSRALLQCLDEDHRIAFVLGEILELSSVDGAEILDIEPATFRKRLSRARTTLGEVLGTYCSVVNPDAPCGCHRRFERAIQLGRLRPDKPDTIEVTEGKLAALRARIKSLQELERVTAYYRDEPDLVARRDFVAGVRTLLATHKENS